MWQIKVALYVEKKYNLRKGILEDNIVICDFQHEPEKKEETNLV